MNLRDLKYLVAVAKYKHFGKAADESAVSQPALSMQLKKLEEELGVQLFERDNKNVMVTPVGQKIVEKANEILLVAKEMEAIAKTFHNPLAGEIKIGAFPTLAPYFLPSFLPKVIKKFPELKMLLVEEKTELLINKLKKGEIDAAFLAVPLPQQEDKLHIEKLFNEAFYLAVPKKHPFAEKKTISRSDLSGEKLLLLEDGHCLREQSLEVCSLMGAKENQDFRATSLETLRQMVASGIGITLIPQMAINKNSDVVYIPFNKEIPARTIALIWRKTSPRDELLKKISQLAVN